MSRISIESDDGQTIFSGYVSAELMPGKVFIDIIEQPLEPADAISIGAALIKLGGGKCKSYQGYQGTEYDPVQE